MVVIYFNKCANWHFAAVERNAYDEPQAIAE